MKRPRSLARWALATALVAGGAGYWFFGRAPRGDRDKPESRFQTTTVEQGPITARVTATGTLSALVTVQIGSQVSGRLQEILVDFNSEATQGQVLSRLNPLLLNAAPARPLGASLPDEVEFPGRLASASMSASDMK